MKDHNGPITVGWNDGANTSRSIGSRRAFLIRSTGMLAAVSGVAVLIGPRGLPAQPSQSVAGGVPMTEDSYKAVWRPAKPGAMPTMDVKEIEAFERKLACPCPCNLDVYTCRTTDFSCGISPAVHADIQRLVEGGYTADEIMAAMTETYGDFILMMPRREGFNLLAWFAPFTAIAVGGVAIGFLLRRWRLADGKSSKGRSVGVAGENMYRTGNTDDGGIEATPEELARLDAALREDR